MLSQEIAAAAAVLVAEDGLDYGQAKRKAAKALGQGLRASDLPSNEAVEAEVRAHLAMFQADTQPAELAALRQLAMRWMIRLAPFRPHVGGAVWRGTANRHSVIHIELFCDDPKSAEIELINMDLRFDAGVMRDERRGEHSVLSLSERCAGLSEPATLHLSVLDYDALRGALKADSNGRSWRGDAQALRRLIEQEKSE